MDLGEGFKITEFKIERFSFSTKFLFINLYM